MALGWCPGCGGGPKPWDARRGDAAKLLVFPITGLVSLECFPGHKSAPSARPPVCVSMLGIPAPRQCCGCPAQPRGLWVLWGVVTQSFCAPTMPKPTPWALVAVINLRTWLRWGDPIMGCASPKGGEQQHHCPRAPPTAHGPGPWGSPDPGPPSGSGL